MRRLPSKLKTLLLLSIFAISIFSCSKHGKNDVLRVAVAANLTYVSQEIMSAFLEEASLLESEIEFVFGSSGKLSAQIQEGAPFDVFLSANMKYPLILKEKGYAKSDVVNYAEGELVLFSLKVRSLENGVLSLTNEDVKKISLANPSLAPYGLAAYEALSNSFIFEKVEGKLMDAQTITKALLFTLEGADAGFIAFSSLYAKNLKKYLKEDVYYYSLDSSLYTPIKQGMVSLSEKEDAKAFFLFMQSAKAKKILKAYGYKTDE